MMKWPVQASEQAIKAGDGKASRVHRVAKRVQSEPASEKGKGTTKRPRATKKAESKFTTNPVELSKPIQQIKVSTIQESRPSKKQSERVDNDKRAPRVKSCETKGKGGNENQPKSKLRPSRATEVNK